MNTTIKERLVRIKRLISHMHYASAITDAADEVMNLVRSRTYGFPMALARVCNIHGLPKEDIQAELQRRRTLVRGNPQVDDVNNPDFDRSHVLDYIDPTDE